MSDRLAQLTDLSAWQVSVTGKGETQPRIDDTSEEARAANRRVEITATPTSPEEAKPPTAQDDGELPETTAPTATGEQGVDTTVDDVTLHLALPEVTRVGNYLTGNVELTPANDDLSQLTYTFTAADPTTENRWGVHQTVSTLSGATLLTGTTRYYPVDYVADDVRYPLTCHTNSSVIKGTTARLAAVWPDTGQDSVTLDIPGKTDDTDKLAARLTDIPVTDA